MTRAADSSTDEERSSGTNAAGPVGAQTRICPAQRITSHGHNPEPDYLSRIRKRTRLILLHMAANYHRILNLVINPLVYTVAWTGTELVLTSQNVKTTWHHNANDDGCDNKCALSPKLYVGAEVALFLTFTSQPKTLIWIGESKNTAEWIDDTYV